MHLTETFTGLSDAALIGIQSLGENALLLCSNCVYIKQQLKMKLSSRTNQKQEEKMINFETELSDLKLSVEGIKTTLQKKPQAETQNKPRSSRRENIPDQEELTGVKFRGVAEWKDKVPRIRHKHDLSVIKKNCLNVK